MEILCWSCRTENWLENQSRCLSCGSFLRRCADCQHYRADKELCAALALEIDRRESECPTPLANSVGCQSYAPQPRAVPHAA